MQFQERLARSPGVIVIVAALLLTLALLIFTRPENTGDSVDWARDVASAPSIATPSLFEPGHLLWRPLGVVLRDFLSGLATGDAAAISDAQRRFTVVAAAGTALVTTSIGLLVLGMVGSVAAALLAVILTALGAAVVNFGQAGSPYVPGIALVSAALYAGTLRPPISLARAALAGGLLAAGVLLWLPYVLVVPAGCSPFTSSRPANGYRACAPWPPRPARVRRSASLPTWVQPRRRVFGRSRGSRTGSETARTASRGPVWPA